MDKVRQIMATGKSRLGFAARAGASLTANDARWQAVTARERAADGQFVYAVRTTGIYCRPTCPSKRPRRDNVLFFDTNAEAAKAGFRACLRCHPDRAHEGPDAAILAACRKIAASAALTASLRPGAVCSTMPTTLRASPTGSFILVLRLMTPSRFQRGRRSAPPVPRE